MATQVQMGGRDTAPYIRKLRTRRGLAVSPYSFIPGKDWVPIAPKAGWASGVERLAPTGIRSPERY